VVWTQCRDHLNGVGDGGKFALLAMSQPKSAMLSTKRGVAICPCVFDLGFDMCVGIPGLVFAHISQDSVWTCRVRVAS
jgi:hypothetical protein